MSAPAQPQYQGKPVKKKPVKVVTLKAVRKPKA